MTATARPRRPVPTVPVHPRLLVEGDMVYPDIDRPSPAPFRVAAPPQRDDLGWLVFLDGGCLLYLPPDAKVRTQRRGSPHTLTPEQADLLADDYPRSPR